MKQYKENRSGCSFGLLLYNFFKKNSYRTILNGATSSYIHWNQWTWKGIPLFRTALVETGNPSIQIEFLLEINFKYILKFFFIEWNKSGKLFFLKKGCLIRDHTSHNLDILFSMSTHKKYVQYMYGYILIYRGWGKECWNNSLNK